MRVQRSSTKRWFVNGIAYVDSLTRRWTVRALCVRSQFGVAFPP